MKKFTLPKDGGLIEAGLPNGIKHTYERIPAHIYEDEEIASRIIAQKIADEQNLDLVKISPQAKPPVCKIMDYGKYRFEQAKREKENRKNQKVVNTKEVQLSPSIDTNDFTEFVNYIVRSHSFRFVNIDNSVFNHNLEIASSNSLLPIPIYLCDIVTLECWSNSLTNSIL